MNVCSTTKHVQQQQQQQQQRVFNYEGCSKINVCSYTKHAQ